VNDVVILFAVSAAIFAYFAFKTEEEYLRWLFFSMSMLSIGFLGFAAGVTPQHITKNVTIYDANGTIVETRVITEPTGTGSAARVAVTFASGLFTVFGAVLFLMMLRRVLDALRRAKEDDWDRGW